MVDSFNLGSIFASLDLDDRPFARALRGLQQPLRRFGRIASRTFSATRRAAARLTRTIGGLGRGLGRLAGRLFSIRGIVAALAGGFGAIKLVELAGEVDKADDAFGRLARTMGSDATRAIERFREASRGTISDLEIIRSVNQAFVLGAGRSVDELESLFELSRRIATTTTRSSSQAFSDLALGIGRRSRQILDNLGIIVRVDEANRRFADGIDKTVQELTDEEKTLAFNREALRQTREVVESLGADTLTLSNRIEQFRAGLGNFFAQIARNITPALEVLFETLRSLDTGGLTARIGQLLSDSIFRLADFIRENGDQIIDFFRDLLDLLAKLTAIAADLGEGFVENLRSLTSAGNIGEALGDFFVTRITGLLQTIGGIGALIVGKIIEAFEINFDAIKAFFVGLGGAIAEGFFEAAGSAFRILFPADSPIPEAVEAGASAGGQIAERGLRLAREGLDDLLEGVFNRTTEQLGEVARIAGVLFDRVAKDLAPVFGRPADQFERVKTALDLVEESAGLSAEELARNVELTNQLKRALNTLSAARGTDLLGRVVEQLRGVEGDLSAAEQRREEARILTQIEALTERLGAAEQSRLQAIQAAADAQRRSELFQKNQASFLDDQVEAHQRLIDFEEERNVQLEAQLRSVEEELRTTELTKDQRESLLDILRRQLELEGKLNEERARQQKIQRRTSIFLQDLTFGVIEAIENGESAIRSLARAFRDELERQLSDVISDIADQLGKQLSKALGSSLSGQIIGTAIFAAASIAIAELQRREERGADVTEIPIEEIATSQSAVRGVVAGPQNIAIAEVGAGIREANRGVESLLRDILETLRSIADNNNLAAGGFGTVGTG